MSDREPAKAHWWHSAPVVVSAIAGLLTAVTGLVVGLHQAGVIGGGGSDRSSAAAAAPNATPSTTATQDASPSSLAAPAPPVTSPAAEPLTGPPGRNLLSPQYGGRLVAAPQQSWASANDGVLAHGTVISFLDASAIFGFQDDRPATFDRFGILILEADENPATIEIAAGDALTGPFRPVAKVQILNLYVTASDGWQYFDVPRTTTRYVRITTGAKHNLGIMGYISELSLDEKPSAKPDAKPTAKD